MLSAPAIGWAQDMQLQTSSAVLAYGRVLDIAGEARPCDNVLFAEPALKQAERPRPAHGDALQDEGLRRCALPSQALKDASAILKANAPKQRVLYFVHDVGGDDFARADHNLARAERVE